MAKEYFEKGDVSNSTSALDAYGQCYTQGFALIYDEYGNIKTEFQAQVLSRPILTTGRESGDGDSQHAKFMYQGRIKHNPSPHDYLPDPCDASLALSEEEALELIVCHTTFYSNSDLAHLGYDTPKIGDIVNVKLEPGDFSYNLADGTHLNTINTNNATVRDPALGENTILECKSLVDLFGAGAVPFLGTYASSGLGASSGRNMGIGTLDAKEVPKEDLLALAKRCRGPDYLGPSSVTNLGATIGLTGMKEGKQEDLCCGTDKIVAIASTETKIWTWNWLDQRTEPITIDHTLGDDEYIKALGTVAVRNPEFLCIAQLRVIENYAKICEIQSIGAREIHRRAAIADPRLVEEHQRKPGDNYGPMTDMVRLKSGWAWTPDCGHKLCRKFGSSNLLPEMYKCHKLPSGRGTTYTDADRQRDQRLLGGHGSG